MKKRMIQMLATFLMLCLTTASKQTNSITPVCKATLCIQDNSNAPEAAQEEETILSPINLFMIHAQ